MKLSRQGLRKLIIEEITRLHEGDVVQFPGLPDEFGNDPRFSYRSRGKGLETKMSHIGRDLERRDEEIIAVALSNRAEELIDYAYKVSPEYFDDAADELAWEWRTGALPTDTPMTLDQIVGMIDSGPFWDGVINDTPDWRRSKDATDFQQRAKQGHDRDVEYMEILRDQCLDGDNESCEELSDMERIMGFKVSTVSGDSEEDWIYDLEGEIEAKMQGIESGDVIEFPQDDD